jgi:hypothetical protein
VGSLEGITLTQHCGYRIHMITEDERNHDEEVFSCGSSGSRATKQDKGR